MDVGAGGQQRHAGHQQDPDGDRPPPSPRPRETRHPVGRTGGHASAPSARSRPPSRPCGRTHEDGDDEEVGHGRGPLHVDVGRRERLTDTQDHRAESGTDQAAEPAEDDDAQDPPDPHEVGVGIELVQHRQRGAAEARRGGADGEHPRHGALHVDADQGSTVAVGRAGTDGPADERPAQQREQAGQQDGRPDAGVELRPGNDQGTHLDRGVEVRRRGRVQLRAPHQGHEAAGRDGHPERGDHRELVVDVVDPRDDGPVEHPADAVHHRGHQDAEDQRIDPGALPHPPGEEGGEHDHRGVRQVDDLHDAEDQGESRGHQRVDATHEQSEDERLQEEGHGARPSRQEPAAARVTAMPASRRGSRRSWPPTPGRRSRGRRPGTVRGACRPAGVRSRPS